MHRNGGHLKECLGTSRIDKFAKLKAQPAKKCLFFVSFHTLLPKHRAADSFSLLCTNIESSQSFHCWKEPWDVMSAVQLYNLLWVGWIAGTGGHRGESLTFLFQTMSSQTQGRVSIL